MGGGGLGTFPESVSLRIEEEKYLAFRALAPALALIAARVAMVADDVDENQPAGNDFDSNGCEKVRIPLYD